MVSFGKRIPAMPLYSLFLIPLLAVMALRLIAMSRHHRRAVGAGYTTRITDPRADVRP